MMWREITFRKAGKRMKKNADRLRLSSLKYLARGCYRYNSDFDRFNLC